MSTWYRTVWHESSSPSPHAGPKIEEVQILKSTTASVWMGERRSAKRSSYENFFETRAEAVAFIRAAQQERIDFHKRLAACHEENLKALSR